MWGYCTQVMFKSSPTAGNHRLYTKTAVNMYHNGDLYFSNSHLHLKPRQRTWRGREDELPKLFDKGGLSHPKVKVVNWSNEVNSLCWNVI